MKLILSTIISLFLSACYYPTVRPEIDPITKVPTGHSQTERMSGDPYTGLVVAGSAFVADKHEKSKKPKKPAPFPKPPEEVLKPMAEEK